MTAMANPTKAVTPNVTPAAVLASILSLVLCEDFCVSWPEGERPPSTVFTPIIFVPRMLVLAANSLTELSKKEKYKKYYNFEITMFRNEKQPLLFPCQSRRSNCKMTTFIEGEQVLEEPRRAGAGQVRDRTRYLICTRPAQLVTSVTHC